MEEARASAAAVASSGAAPVAPVSTTGIVPLGLLRPAEVLLGAVYGRTLRVVAFGRSRPQGSQQHRFVASLGRTVAHEKPSLLEWRGEVRRAAADALPAGWPLLDGPIELLCVYYRPRPKGWPRWRRYATTAPDSSKLQRGVEDALEGIVYRNDSQLVVSLPVKAIGEPARCEILVREILEPRSPSARAAERQEALL